MQNLRSKFSINQVIIIPIILTLVICFLISIICFVSFSTVNEETPLYKTPIWASLIFILLLLWNIYYYLKTFKHYTFFNRGFEVSNVFGKEFNSWETVEQISIIETGFEKVLWQYMNEDTLTIHLKNGKTLELYSKYYRNMNNIRQYFSSNEDLIIVNSYSKNINKCIERSTNTSFKGSFLLTFNGFVVIFLLLLSSFSILNSQSSITTVGLCLFIGLPLLFILIFGFQAYYFQLNQKYLIIKNHIFCHIKHQINLEKVRVIYFEQKFKKESSIRIINDDYSITSFQASSLKNKHWKSLILKLKNIGVNVVDELFYEYYDE